MTEHDLSTLVRDHVSSNEPSFPGPDHAISRGRRTVRTRRLTAGSGVAVVLAVAGALVVPQLTGTDDLGKPTGIDPAVQKALDEYDAQAMPRLIERAASRTFSQSVPDLGQGEFAAFDGNGTEIGPEHYDKASGMSVSYGGDSTHRLDVSLDHAKSEAEGDHDKLCAESLEEGYYLECDAQTLDNGDILVTYVSALRPFPRDDQTWWGVTRDELATRNPDNLWFLRHAEVIKSDTFLTTVEETVKARSLDEAEQAFQVPIDDLAALAADPHLILPKPPPDEIGGCPQWILPGSRVTCGKVPAGD